MTKSFQFAFGDLVAVHITKERRQWKFDLRWDVGIFIGQPEASVDAAIVYYPFDGKILIRTDVIKLDITDDAYRRYYSCRHDLLEDKRSTPTRVGEILLAQERNITKELQPDNANDADPPLTAVLVEPDELPPRLTAPQRQRTKRTWDHLPPRRVTRASERVAAHPAICPAYSSDQHRAARAIAARATGPRVHGALKSLLLRSGWVTAMDDEINTVIEKFKCLVEEEIDTSQPYDLLDATMQLRKKMKTGVIVDKLKARICICGNQLDEVDDETYSPTVAPLTHAFMLQLAVHDRMIIQLVDAVAAYLNQDYPEDAKQLYVRLPKLVAQAVGRDPEKTYRVKKYVYGLPDS